MGSRVDCQKRVIIRHWGNAKYQLYGLENLSRGVPVTRRVVSGLLSLKKSSYRSDFLPSRLLDWLMSLIDRYVLKEWLVGFVLTLGVIVGILILQNMYDSLPDLLDANASFKQIL